MTVMPAVAVKVLVQYKHDKVLKTCNSDNIAKSLATWFQDGARSMFVLFLGKVYFCKYDADNLCLSKTLVTHPSSQLLSAFSGAYQYPLITK